MNRSLLIIGAMLGVLALGSACGGGAGGGPPAPPPTSQPTARPTATPTLVPSPSPSPTATSSPTASPTASPTPTPTATPTPTPTPTAAPTFTPLPSPTPTVAPTPTAAPSYLPDTVQPIFDCVGHSGSSFYMLFGYNNPLATPVTLDAGTVQNEVILSSSSGNTVFTGQPSTFFPGLHDRLFQVPLPTGEVTVTWTLDGNTIGPYPRETTAC